MLEISKSALKNNIRFLKSFFNGGTIISSVVKANAYGHDITKYVPLAESEGLNHFSVFSTDEAREVLKSKTGNPTIMIMGWIDLADLDWVIENNIEFYVYDIEKLEQSAKVAKKLRTKARIHVEVETGLNRTGLKRRQFKKAASIIKNNKDCLKIKGLCTHYAGAESIANHVRVQRQITRYFNFYNWFFANEIMPELRHTASSAAALSYPRTRMDMVRIGILQYGFWPSPETQVQYFSKNKGAPDPLQRLITWKSRVMTVKNVNQGEFVSYGTAYFAHEKKRIAVIPVGYSHGYSRSLSNQGIVLIREHRVKVIGYVNMNMLIADVTSIPGVETGDEVVLIGSQGDFTISLAAFTDFSNQLNYELLTRLPANIPRIIVD